MKLKIIFFLFLLTATAYSQDLEPTQHKFTGQFEYLSADSSYFQQNHIILGWHWGASPKISHALNANQNDASRNVTPQELDSNCYIIVKPAENTHAVGPQVLNVRAIQYEPTLLLDPNNPEKLVIRHGDTTRPVFGFLNRRGRILTDFTEPNFNRLIIDSSSLVNEVILSEPWPSNQLCMAGEYIKDQTKETIDTFLCRWMYFSINLRRSGSEMSDDAVLKIELPYSYLYDSLIITIDTSTTPPHNDTTHITVSHNNNIQFSTIPDTSQFPSGIDTLKYGRGLIKDTIHVDPGVREFYITKKMLPPANQDITISAFFILDGKVIRHNHELKEGPPIIDKIDSIKIKITYLGGDTLKIDWVRLETPHAQEFLRGEYDSLMTLHVQEDLNYFSADTFANHNKKLFRYNPIIEGGLMHWIGEKYFNKLIGNISSSETQPCYPEHFGVKATKPEF